MILKKGTKLICIDDNEAEVNLFRSPGAPKRLLTEGKIYTVKETCYTERDACVEVIEDNGQQYGFYLRRFKVIKQRLPINIKVI